MKFNITDRIDHTNDLSEGDGIWLTPTPPCPKSVKISLDDHCNFKCDFCCNSTQNDHLVMQWEMFTKLIDELVANGTEEIGLFFIGEPMMAKNLLRAVQYVRAAKSDMYIFLTTNGALASPDKLEPLMLAGLNSIKFSYNYTDGEQIKQVAHVPPKVFDLLVNNIREARKLRDRIGAKCGIYASSIMFNGEQGARMKQAVTLINDYVDQHYWLPQYSFGAQTDFGDQVLGNPGRLDRLRHPLPCWTILKEAHVTAAGQVALCCFAVDDKWAAGNLKEMSFMEAWHSPAAQALRRAHLNKDARGTACENCAHGAPKQDSKRARTVIKITRQAAPQSA